MAAVALPQYQKAVTKARFAEAFTNLKTIGEAYTVCKLNGGTCDFDKLDIDVGKNEYDTGLSRTTENFTYYTGELQTANNADTVSAYALYKKEDVCLCYRNNGIIQIRQNDSCGPADTSFDYAKLLNLPEEEDCCCC